MVGLALDKETPGKMEEKTQNKLTGNTERSQALEVATQAAQKLENTEYEMVQLLTGACCKINDTNLMTLVAKCIFCGNYLLKKIEIAGEITKTCGFSR